MISATSAQIATWLISALAILGVIVRPWKLPEAIWATLGALTLVVFSLISPFEALRAVRKGTDVYLFLIGMMLLAEIARQEGLFDWLAAYAVLHSKGSPANLFLLIYCVGTLVTIFLSNDATAVVLTPAVYAATRRARARPLPYLFICAFIANAASFVLPISNPANLVVYGTHMPRLWAWLTQFGVASIVSIIVTYIALRFALRADLTGSIFLDQRPTILTSGGRVAAAGIAVTAIILMIASSQDWQLGLPTFLAGVSTGGAILMLKGTGPWPVLKGISWSVIPLVAGLFVLVQGIEHTGVLAPLARLMSVGAQAAPDLTALSAGGAVALLCNAVNNLPMGLIAGTVASSAHLSPYVTGALLIGVDLGPNLSVTGSLATILWLVALRREGQDVSAWKFLLLGGFVMPPALLASLASFVGLAMR